MKRAFLFARRTLSEWRRDPLTVCFAVVLPLLLTAGFGFAGHYVAGLCAVFSGAELFCGATVLSFSLISVPLSRLAARDRTSGYLCCLSLSSVGTGGLFFGYLLAGEMLCAVPFAVTLAVTEFFGVFGGGFVTPAAVGAAMTVWLFAAPLYVLFGLLIGLVCPPRLTPFVCAALVCAAGFLGEVWLPLSAAGVFHDVCLALPFLPPVFLSRLAASGGLPALSGRILPLVALLAYPVLLTSAVCVRMRRVLFGPRVRRAR